MVQPKGWGGVKPYWWCDNEHTHAIATHLRLNIPQEWHLFNGIYVKGIDKDKPESIIIGSINECDILNINICTGDFENLLQLKEAINLLIDQSVIDNTLYIYNKEEYFKKAHTYNLQYKWQQLDKKLKRTDL